MLALPVDGAADCGVVPRFGAKGPVQPIFGALQDRRYSAAWAALSASISARNFSASSAAMQPMPALVTACR